MATINTASTWYENDDEFHSQKKYRVGFICAFDPSDRNHFSGTIHYMHRALSDCPDVEVFLLGIRPSKVVNLCRKTLKKVGGKPLSWLNSRVFEKLIHDVEDDLEEFNGRLDFIVAPVASKIIAAVNASKLDAPVFFVTDATPAFLREEYGAGFGAPTDELEKLVFNRSAKIIYSSHYMAERAVKEYAGFFGDKNSKVEVIPFGLNIDEAPEFLGPKSIEGKIELLFVGRDWKRKGGDVAVAAAEYLHDKGYPVRLTIIGSSPDVSQVKADVEVIPFINKNIPIQYELFNALHRRAHFLILPTLADCTPMVIAEANTFGTPALVANVGGISSLIENGKNGILMSPGVSGKEYALNILELKKDPLLYRQMSFGSRQAFEQKLNWRAWAEQIKMLAQQESEQSTSNP